MKRARMGEGGEGAEQYDQPGGPVAYGGAPSEPVFPCVKLRGLPFDVTDANIRDFLELEAIDILMVKRDGRFSGEAFVLLGSASLLEAAQAKHKMYLGSRFVEVFLAKKLDYYRAVASEMGGTSSSGAGGRPRYDAGGGMPMGGYGGMPPPMGGHDHMGYGHPPPMMGPPGGYGHGHGGGYGGGQPYGGYDAHGMGMGGYGAAASGYGGSSGPVASGTQWIKMRGLPFSVIMEDIVDFFTDPALGLQRPDPSKVHLWNENGRPTGMALVEFPSPQIATIALQKNKAVMGTRYIELFPATRGDLEKYSSKNPPLV